MTFDVEFPKRLRRLVLEECAAIPHERVALALSAGVDSTALALALREVGKDVSAYSFTLRDRESRDYLVARENAERLGIPFQRVSLPIDAKRLDEDVRYIIGFRTGLGLPTRKAATECTWPFLYLLNAVAQRGLQALVTGSAADGNYGLSKRAMIHFRYPKDTFDEFRRGYFADPDRAQVETVRRLANVIGEAVALDSFDTYAPWRAAPVVNALFELDWDSLNKPRQKEVAWRAFPELESLRLYRHTNLQLGDSGIAEHFESLRAFYDGASPTAIYNRIAKGLVDA